MPIVVERLPGEPIIVATFAEPMNYNVEVPAMFARILELRDTIEGSPKYYVVIDISAVKPGFSDIMMSLGEVRKASAKRRAELPISPHLAGTGDFFSMLSKAMNQAQYGGYTAPLHTSAAEALSVIRAEIGAK
jgi:hypothetical protein